VKTEPETSYKTANSPQTTNRKPELHPEKIFSRLILTLSSTSNS
jgi:hypothetical protein